MDEAFVKRNFVACDESELKETELQWYRFIYKCCSSHIYHVISRISGE